MERSEKLKATTKLLYAFGDVGNATVNSAIQFFLLVFFTDAALIAPALTDDDDERASLTAFRMVLGVPAYLVGAALTPAIAGMFASKRMGYASVGIIYAVIAVAAPFRNRPFVQLILAIALLLLIRYPTTRESHAELRKKLDAMEA